MLVDTIQDLKLETPQEIERIRASIDMRGTFIRQAAIDGHKKGLTLAAWQELAENPPEHPCHDCRGTGIVRPKMRVVGSIHPSSAHRCRLRQYYDVTGEFAPEEDIPYHLQLTFDIGHTLHHFVQKTLHHALGENFADEVEVNLSEALIFGGSADGVVQIPGCRVLLEIKSMSGDGYTTLRKPKEEHLLQASIYAKALNIPFISFLYISKEDFKHPIKEYVVVYNEAVYRQWYAEKVHPIEIALETGRAPIADATKYECKDCAYSGDCPQRLGNHDPFRR